MRLDRLAIATAPVVFVLLWSTGFIGTKYGLPYAEPLTFLTLRMVFVVALLVPIAWIVGARWPDRREVLHSVATGLMVHGLYLGGVFVAIAQGVPAGISALIPGLQPILVSTIASRFMGERVGPLQWLGLALGLIGVLLVLHDRSIIAAGSIIGWIATVVSLLGIAFGTLYQKKFGGGIDWRTGNVVQYAAACQFFAIGAFLFETRAVQWAPDFIAAMAWLVIVLSIGTVALMYWLIRRSPATGFASLFYLVPVVTALMAYVLFDERLDAISVVGMVICAAGVFLVNRAQAAPKARAN